MNPKESNNDLPQEFFLQQQQMAIFDINNTNFGYNPDYAVYNVKVNALTTITCTLPDITYVKTTMKKEGIFMMVYQRVFWCIRDMEGAVFYIKFDPTSGLTGTINIV